MIRGGIISIALLSALLCFNAPAGADPGTALRNVEIKAEPFRDAKVVGALKTGDKVEILKRSAGWYRVKSGKNSGWVRMLSIRRGTARKRDVAANDVLALASGRAGTGRVVATTGIRGLNEEELKNAKFNEAEVKKLESFTIAPENARKFAEAGNLVVQRLDDLRNPQ